MLWVGFIVHAPQNRVDPIRELLFLLAGAFRLGHFPTGGTFNLLPEGLTCGREPPRCKETQTGSAAVRRYKFQSVHAS